MRNIQNLKAFKTPKSFRGKGVLYVQLWWLVQATLFKWSPQFMYSWRRFLLRMFGAKIGKKVIIRPSVEITYPWKVSIGDYSWVGDDVVLYSLGEIEIGSNTVVSQKSYICTGSHHYNSETFEIYSKKVTIGNKCWLATDVYVAPAVTIGDFTVVGARSSVFSDLPANKVCVGSPAKAIKDRA
ncbi:putative colanic acid biosynthesis acetyltransferase [uncultured Winogradskyella sp.]|uniref:putative colanic acid biosynthesis acetyltransferase n=1 Tax=uncultured Winogradskyella sp. TaxID=395353 RepID=UPI00262A77D6|nr:putative colanic acid biosynthesis acetyltransferase [uncultured Winogradskyella sp.]